MVSSARHRRSRPQSFPRKRESTPQTLRNALSTGWIPAFAGMTGVSQGMRFQMTPLPGGLRTRTARWATTRSVTNQSAPHGEMRDRIEAST